MRSRGFTLVELIVVMLVLGILAAVFIPRSNNPAIILSTQAEQFAADIRYLQSLAMTQGWSGVAARRYVVNFTATGYKFTDVNGVPVAQTDGTTGSRSFTGGVSISPFPVATFSSVAGYNVLSFDGLGQPYTDASAVNPLTAMATVSIVNGGSTRAILIFPGTGMVRVQ